MPASVIDPHDGDDLTAASITTNVTDKIVAWETSHETGAVANGAVRHVADQIDELSLPEITTPTSTAITGAGNGGVHVRFDMVAVALSAIMGSSGSGYAAKYASLIGLTYPSVNAINTALTTGANSAAGSSTLVRRATDGSANFTGTVGMVAISGTGNWATTGSVTSVDATHSGVIRAGSGAHQITTVAGNLDATQLANALPAGSMPALTGDVTNTAGSLATTVSAVGGKTASQVGTVVTSILAASSTGVGNHGANAKFDASGGMTFDAAVTAPVFYGLIGNDRLIPFQKLQDLAPSATGTTLVVTVQGGSYLAVASSAIVQRVFTQSTITLVAPTTGNQWQAIYIDNTATLQDSPGTVGGTKDTAPLPSGGYAVAWAFLPQNATALYSTQADWTAAGSPSTKGYLVPQNVNGGASGGGAGGSGAAVTSPFAIWGSNGGLGLSANAQGVDTVLALPTSGATLPTVNGVNLNQVVVHPSRSARVFGDTTSDDTQQAFLSPDLISRLSASGTTMALAASATNVAFVRNRRITATLTSNAASGAAGQRFLFIDLTTAPPTLILQTSSTAPNSLSVMLSDGIWWDGATLQTATVLSTRSLQSVSMANATYPIVRANATGLDSSPLVNVGSPASYQAFSNFAAQDFYAAVDCSADVLWRAYYKNAAVPVGTALSIALQVYNQTTNFTQNVAVLLMNNGWPANGQLTMADMDIPIRRGHNYIAIVGYAQGASTALTLGGGASAVARLYGG